MQSKPIEDLWDDAYAATLSAPELLRYRSNLLGSDLRITNYGGGNTSAKIRQTDPLTGREVEVLWVKGSGGDLGSADLSGFASLYQDKLLALEAKYRGREHEDEMVGYLAHCTFNLNPRAASIDTPLHAYLPFAHVDHMHPDAAIAIAASKNSERLTREVFEGEMGWVPWQRPGFDLALKLRDAVKQSPRLAGIVLAGHGIFTWGETSKQCYQNTLRIIRRVTAWLAEHAATPAFGGAVTSALGAAERAALAAELMPILRGKISDKQRKIGHFNDSPEVLEFTSSRRLGELAALGTSCPDHFLRTKIRPLVLPFESGKSTSADVVRDLDSRLAAYREEYRAYYERCKVASSPAMRDPNPVVYLIPGVGMLTFAADKATARIAGEFYVNAINVMRGASGVDEYVGLDEKEAFGIEYWLLEEAKLKRLPPPRPMAGRVAVVTGGAGGIGQAVARRILAERGAVVLFDIDADALESARKDLSGAYGKDVVRTARCDVTSEESVGAAFAEAVREYGGVDIVVSNAGLASAAGVADTTLELWRRNMDVLTTGYFLVSREGFRVMNAQGIGGSIVFVASKNALVASPGAIAYCTAKSAELHLARCLALEGAESKIRVNVVNPDAVLSGSRIWAGKWRDERAQAYGVLPEELEEHYRKRSLLKQNVVPEDIAEGVYFFASDLSRNSTGNILNVDAGNLAAFTR